MDMVKPIPPKHPVAISSPIFAFPGHGVPLIFPIRRTDDTIPKGLPTHRPRIIPMPTGVKRPDSPPSRGTPALARAKTGMMRNADHGANLCSSLCRRDVDTSSVAGRIIPAHTPAMVECTPPFKKQNQAMKPQKRYGHTF